MNIKKLALLAIPAATAIGLVVSMTDSEPEPKPEPVIEKEVLPEPEPQPEPAEEIIAVAGPASNQIPYNLEIEGAAPGDLVQIVFEDSSQNEDGSQIEMSVRMVADNVLYTTAEGGQAVLELKDAIEAQKVDEMLSDGGYAVSSLDELARRRGLICTPIKCVSFVRNHPRTKTN